ncbi:hypothetical protein BAE44_0002202, partial [Dichanthelium oligosanthes]
MTSSEDVGHDRDDMDRGFVFDLFDIGAGEDKARRRRPPLSPSATGSGSAARAPGSPRSTTRSNATCSSSTRTPATWSTCRPCPPSPTSSPAAAAARSFWLPCFF